MKREPAECRRRGISGQIIIACMFAMGLTATGLLFLYWNMHLMPFMPLQEAIVAEFPDSAPRVDGGRRKLHQKTPFLLRVVVRVPFDPTESDAGTEDRLMHYMNRIRDLAEKHTKLTEFEVLELHFYFPVKEQELRELTLRRDLRSWQPVDEDGQLIVSKEASTEEAQPEIPVELP